MKTFLLTCVALAAAGGWGVPAQAQDSNNWYLSIAGTLSLLDDADMLVSNLPTPAGYVKSIHLLNSGHGGQLAVGRSFGRTRLEVQGGYTQNHSRRYVALVPPTGNIPSNGEQNAWRAMANGYFDIGSGRIRPYLGAGLGWTRVHVSVFAPRAPFPTEAPRGIVDTHMSAFAYQLMGGASIQLTPRLMLSAQYRWHSGGELQGKDLSAFPLSRDHAGHNVDIGLCIRL